MKSLFLFLLVGALPVSYAHAQSLNDFGRDSCLAPPGCSSVEPPTGSGRPPTYRFSNGGQWGADVGLGANGVVSFTSGTNAVARGELALTASGNYRLEKRASTNFTDSIGASLQAAFIGESFGVQLALRQQLPLRTMVGIGPHFFYVYSPRVRFSSLLGVLPEIGVLFERAFEPRVYARSSFGLDYLIAHGWLLRPRVFMMATFTSAHEIGGGAGIDIAHCFGCSAHDP